MPWLAVIWVVGIVPFAVWLVRPDPAALGWLPDGERVSPDVAPVRADGAPFPEAVRTRFFVAVTVGYVLVLGAQVGGIQQLVKLVEERTDADTATLATIVLAGTSVVARLAGGRVVARLPMAGFTAVLAVVQALSLVAIAWADATVALFAAIVLFGATVGNILMLQPLLIAERFGVLDYPRIFSRSQFVTMFGTAGGPLLLGWLYDNAGGYDTSYLVAAACSLAGAAVLAWGGPATVPDSEWIATPTSPGSSKPAPAGLTIEPRRFPDGAKTAADAAAAIGVDVGQIVKSLIFAVDGEVVLAYVSGANQLDEAKLAAAAGGERCCARRRRRRAGGHRVPDRRRAAVRPRHRAPGVRRPRPARLRRGVGRRRHVARRVRHRTRPTWCGSAAARSPTSSAEPGAFACRRRNRLTAAERFDRSEPGRQSSSGGAGSSALGAAYSRRRRR